MSNEPKNPTPITVVDPVEPVDVEVSTKPSRLHRAKTFVSTHKSTLIAGTGLVALTAVSAALGRKSATVDALVIERSDGYDDIVIGEVTESVDEIA